MNGPVLLCQSDYAVCPACDQPLRRTNVWDGAGVLTMCGHLIAARVDGQAALRCNQHFILLGVGVLGVVIALTREQADSIREEMIHHGVGTIAICQRLGLLRKHLVPMPVAS